MRNAFKIYILDNGQKITAQELAIKLGCLYSSAISRLIRHSDHKKVLAPMIRQRRNKKHILDNGQKITARELAIKLGCSVSAAGSRLKISSDPKKIFATLKGMGGKNFNARGGENELSAIDHIRKQAGLPPIKEHNAQVLRHAIKYNDNMGQESYLPTHHINL